MYSRCLHCQAQQEISVEQLRNSRGLITCTSCGQRFDALASLSDRADAEFQEEAEADFLPGLPGNESASTVWGRGSVLLGLVLFAQILYFEGGGLIRQPQIRIGLQAICERLSCRLPEYKNLDEWTISHGDLRAISDKSYIFSAAITNQAGFPQACPDLKLVLLNFNGQAVAERIFSGWQYSPVASLAANETSQISLTVVSPSELGKIGGYTFALL